MRHFVHLIVVSFVIILFAPSLSFADSETLIKKAEHADKSRYEYALKNGASIVHTKDNKSFYLLWRPEGIEPKSYIVTIHGHGSYAFDEFYLWHGYAKKYGYGIIALQWWFGEGDMTEDYYSPFAMYPIIEDTLRQLHTPQGKVLLHGFSRGSANIYALTALDRNKGGKFFGMTIANAGGASKDYPPNYDISHGSFGQTPFEGTHWILFAGGKDEHPERDGIPAMTRSKEWIESLGGKIDLFMADREADHGGFHQNKKNTEQALELFDTLIIKTMPKPKTL